MLFKSWRDVNDDPQEISVEFWLAADGLLQSKWA